MSEKPREFWYWKGDGYSSNCHEIKDPKFWEPKEYFGDGVELPKDLTRLISYEAFEQLRAERDAYLKFLWYFVGKKDFTFAECSVAEDLWERAEALLEGKAIKNLTDEEKK